jgi:hypothetical protein
MIKHIVNQLKRKLKKIIWGCPIITMSHYLNVMDPYPH